MTAPKSQTPEPHGLTIAMTVRGSMPPGVGTLVLDAHGVGVGRVTSVTDLGDSAFMVRAALGRTPAGRSALSNVLQGLSNSVRVLAGPSRVRALQISPGVPARALDGRVLGLANVEASS